MVRVVDPNLGGRNWQLGYEDGHLLTLTDPLGKVEGFDYDAENLLTGITDRRGNTATLTYLTPAWDASSRLLQTLNKGGSSTTFVFGPGTKTTTVTDPRGNDWKYRYDGNGRVVEIEDPDGNSATTSWDVNSNPTQMTDPKGNTASFSYDPKGNLLTLTDSLGNVTTWTYEPNFNRMSTATDPKGNVWTTTYDASGNRSKVTDPLGNSIQYSYDPSGQPSNQTDQNGNVTQFGYDAFGNLVSMTNALGATSSFGYDGGNRLVGATDPKGNVTEFTFDLNDRLTDSKDPAGNSSTLVYDDRGNLILKTDRDGSTTQFTYDPLDRNTAAIDPLGNADASNFDAAGNLISYSDRNGNVFDYSFDGLNRLVSLLDPLGNNDKRTYDANGNLAEYEDFLGNKTTFGYDSLNRLTAVTDALGNVLARKYDANGKLIGIENANGDKTTFSYDAIDRMTSLTNALGGADIRSYDPRGNLVEYTDFRGNKTTYAYDALGRQISETDPLANSRMYQYDENGNLKELTNRAGDTTQFVYDGLNRLLKITDPLGNADLRPYTPAGLLKTYADPLGNVRAYNYDALGRLISEVDGRGNADAYVYDGEGNLLSYTDREGNVTQFSYDALNRLDSRTDALGNSDGHQYDANGNRVTYTDRRGNDWTQAYDALNRNISQTNPLGQTWQNAYGPTGRLVARTDAKGQVTTFEYDAIGRVTKQIFDDSSEALFSYDANGNLLTVIDSNTDYSYLYDVRNQKTSYTDNNLGKTVLYTYDSMGRLKTKTDPKGNVVTYDYDAAGNLATLTDPGGASTMSYDVADNLILNQRPVQVRSVFNYDANNQPILVTHYDDLPTAQRPILHQYDYTRDKLGQIVQADLRYYDATQTVHYTYDALGRLTQEKGDLSQDGFFQTSFEANMQYDENGNRTFLDYTDRNGNNIQDTFVYDVANRPISDTSAAGVVNYAHDVNGSRIQKTYNGSVDTYGYDVRNRMVSFQAASMGAPKTYSWDALNKLVGVRYGGLVEEKIMYGRGNPIWQSSGFGLDETSFSSYPDSAPAGNDNFNDPPISPFGWISDGLVYSASFGQVISGDSVTFAYAVWTQGLGGGVSSSARIWHRQFDLPNSAGRNSISSISNSDGHRYTLSDGKELDSRSARREGAGTGSFPQIILEEGASFHRSSNRILLESPDFVGVGPNVIEVSRDGTPVNSRATVSNSEFFAMDIHLADGAINYDSMTPPCIVKWREGFNLLDTRRPEAMWLPGSGSETFFDNDLRSFGGCAQQPYATGFEFSNSGWAWIYDPFASGPTSFGLAGNSNPIPTDRKPHSYSSFEPASIEVDLVGAEEYQSRSSSAPDNSADYWIYRVKGIDFGSPGTNYWVYAYPSDSARFRGCVEASSWGGGFFSAAQCSEFVNFEATGPDNFLTDIGNVGEPFFYGPDADYSSPTTVCGESIRPRRRHSYNWVIGAGVPDDDSLWWVECDMYLEPCYVNSDCRTGVGCSCSDLSPNFWYKCEVRCVCEDYDPRFFGADPYIR